MSDRLVPLLAGAPVGARLDLSEERVLHGALERLVPEALARKYPSWRFESIDGFSFASAVVSNVETVATFGTCILMSDQSVTPFEITFNIAPDHAAIRLITIKLGEPGSGALEISGPGWGSGAAWKLLYSLGARIDRVQWVYYVTDEGPEHT